MERDEGHLDASRGDEEDAVWALSHDTVLIAAFSGWNDAGGAATGATEHIAEVFGCDVVADIDPDEFVDFQVNRPVVDGVGVDRRLVWPGTQISMAYSWNSQRRIVVAHGVEPSFRWRSFTAELLTVAESFGVKTIIVVGALLGDTPHSRPIPVQVSTSDAGVQEFLGTGDSEYEGPTGIVGVISQIAPDAGFTVLSVWGRSHTMCRPLPHPKQRLRWCQRLKNSLVNPSPATTSMMRPKRGKTALVSLLNLTHRSLSMCVSWKKCEMLRNYPTPLGRQSHENLSSICGGEGSPPQIKLVGVHAMRCLL